MKHDDSSSRNETVTTTTTAESADSRPRRNTLANVGYGWRFGGVALFVAGGLIALAMKESAAGFTLITAATGLGFSLRANYDNSRK